MNNNKIETTLVKLGVDLRCCAKCKDRKTGGNDVAYQMTFKRYELKYLMTREQKERILHAMESYMKLDQYQRTTIRNIYYDTDDFRLIRRSLEKPVYKEKLRVRSYQRAGEEDPVFVELKKKYKSVVYKRRVTLPNEQVMNCLNEGKHLPKESQIADEIFYFCRYYENLHPAMFLSYEREAYYSLDESDFRVTFDENILYREEELSLSKEAYGTPILEPDQTLMEIKTSGGIPLWMTKVLSEEKIFKTSFSKYGRAYQMHFLKNIDADNARTVMEKESQNETKEQERRGVMYA